MKLFLALFSVLLQAASADTVLVQGPQSRTLDYLASLHAHPEYQSPTQQLRNALPQPTHKEQLILAMAEAQKAYLSGSRPEAEAKFKVLVGLTAEDEWNETERGALLFGFLRLAQLAADAGQRDEWLTQSLLLGDVKVEVSAFPPPLFSRREELRRQIPTVVVRRPSDPGWREILVNGRPCAKSDCGAWPRLDHPVRVTFLSDQWLPQTVHVTPTHIAELTPPTIPWVTGGCDHARANEAMKVFASVKTFWSLECERPKMQGLNFRPVGANGRDPLAQSQPTPTRTAFYESKWFWMGVGLVATAVVIGVSQQKRGDKSETTTSYGLR